MRKSITLFCCSSMTDTDHLQRLNWKIQVVAAQCNDFFYEPSDQDYQGFWKNVSDADTSKMTLRCVFKTDKDDDQTEDNLVEAAIQIETLERERKRHQMMADKAKLEIEALKKKYTFDENHHAFNTLDTVGNVMVSFTKVFFVIGLVLLVFGYLFDRFTSMFL